MKKTKWENDVSRYEWTAHRRHNIQLEHRIDVVQILASGLAIVAFVVILLLSLVAIGS
jgi:hypothetical protein